MGSYKTDDGIVRYYTTKSAVIANGQSLSGVIDLEQLNITGLLIPAAWTAADITFQVSPDGTTFGDLVDSSGNEVKLSGFAAGKFIGVNLAELSGARYLKIRSGTSASPVNQGAERAISLVLTSNPEASAGGGGGGASEGHIGAVGGHQVTVSATPTLSAPAAYAANDYVGTTATAIVFDNVARVNNGSGIIHSAQLIDKSAQVVAAELWLFDTAITPPTDNAAWSISDADMARCIGVIPFSAYFTSALNSIAPVNNLGIAFKTIGNDDKIYGCLVTRGAPTYADGDLTVKLQVLQD